MSELWPAPNQARARQPQYAADIFKLSVSYPSGEGTTFDHDYYAASHVPLCVSVFSPARAEIDKGVDVGNRDLEPVLLHRVGVIDDRCPVRPPHIQSPSADHRTRPAGRPPQ